MDIKVMEEVTNTWTILNALAQALVCQGHVLTDKQSRNKCITIPTRMQPKSA